MCRPVSLELFILTKLTTYTPLFNMFNPNNVFLFKSSSHHDKTSLIKMEIHTQQK